MIQYCKRCVMPNTKPDLFIDDQGICNACRNYEKRQVVDWDSRKKELHQVLERYRNKKGSNWDCIVPGSGGKDSSYQALKIKQLGMNPLIITSTTCDLSDLGRKNIENLKQQGFDYLELSANPVTRRKLNRIGLTQVGDISWPEHVAIFTSPVRLAVQLKIPLLIWGENSQNEYGGPATAAENNVLNRRWLEEFGGLLGLRVSDMIGLEGIQAKDLIPYTYPSDEELQSVGVTGLFLGYFIPWDGYSNVLYSQAFGLQTSPTVIEGSAVNYENMDNHQMGIHDYFKYLKFAFGRASDLVSLHIRRGRLTREDGMEMIRKLDGKFPWTYLGKPIEKILEPLEISIEEFIKICDRFTNKKLFVTDAKGNLVKDKKGNLQKINEDNI
ncbi:MAG: N-acetyl sugar amidotransferase [Deltaproteobacteria bacterium]|nr:N-acetyl sugar amidotransferase [Deltaproteobacteria bacterium]